MYHALLDLGDVLINVDNAKHMRRLQELMPAYMAEQIDATINKGEEGITLRHQLDCGVINFDQYQCGFEQMFRVSIDPEVFKSIYTARLTLNTPVVNLFKTLAQNRVLKKIVLVSNTDWVSFTRALELLMRAQMQIDHVVVSYVVGARKPDPAMFSAALEIAHARPEECFFVDDKMENVEAARGLGILGIHYRAGKEGAQQFLLNDLEKLHISCS